ncbi:GAF domain-containing protein [Microvirga yunnanensis]|uniref:GAF domain-containing protein n=1 Tax=Microvirga yunnanensis TaxID=2953740 RepID=UPI0021C73332|nr:MULTISPECIES: GAF domain-containing protein [unclassified Microvirga]
MTTAEGRNSTPAGLDDNLITDELARRPSQVPDYEAENRALAALTQEMTAEPCGVLQKCAELALALCHADSTGISLPEPGEEGVFRWCAAGGGLAAQAGRTVPREAGPSDAMLARDSVLLFREGERLFPGVHGVGPPVYEILLAPWHVHGKPVGALWAIKHTSEEQFNAEDARLLQSLAHSAAAAYQTTDALDQAEAGRTELEQQVAERTRALADAYASVQTSEARLRAALEIETVGAIYLDPDGRIIEANEAFLAMGGYSRADLEAGRLTWQRLTPPEWGEVSEHAFAELKATGQIPPYEKEYFRKDGSRWCALFAGKLLPDGMIFEFVLDITARKQAEQALATELKAMTRLHEVSRQVVDGAGLPAVLDAILDATIELHGADFGYMQLYDGKTGTLRIAAQRGFQQPFLDHFANVDATEASTCGMALARRERVVIEDVEQEPAYAPSLEMAREAGYRAVQSTPLVTPSGEMLGMLSTYFHQPHRLTDLDTKLTDVYARLAAEAIARVQAEAALRASEARLAHELNGARQLQRVSSELLVEQHPQTLYEQVLDAMRVIMRSQGASMQILEPDTGTLKLLAWRGFHPDAAAFWDRVDANSASTCGEALRTGRRILVSDVETCAFMAGTEDLAAYRLSNLRAVQSTPLRSRTGRALGMVSTHWRAPHEPSEDDFSHFDVLTRQAADLIERAQTEASLRESERQARLLLAELQHRVRNTLAVIRSIAHQTAETSETVEDYAMHLEGRIDAFARVQAAVTRDPSAGIDLAALVAEELLTCAAREGKQFSLTGPKVRLQPKAAETVGLAIHELATNAVKYGALASPKGHVMVAWCLEDREGDQRLKIEWTETGVPIVSLAPRRGGFGTELLTQTLPYQLRGAATLTFKPGGLECIMELPARGVLQ